MDQFVGLDVSQEQTHVCVIGADGNIVWQGKCGSTPDAIAKAVKAKAPHAVRVALEIEYREAYEDARAAGKLEELRAS